MDNRTPPKPAQTIQPPSRPVPVLPTIVDLTKDVKKPRTPETKQVPLSPTAIPQVGVSAPAPATPGPKPLPKAPAAPAHNTPAVSGKPIPSAPSSHQYGNVVPQQDKKMAPGYATFGEEPTEQIHHFNRVVPTAYSPYTYVPTGPAPMIPYGPW